MSDRGSRLLREDGFPTRFGFARRLAIRRRPWGRWLPITLLLLTAGVSTSCSTPEGSPYAGGCPIFQLLETTPFQGAVDVSPATPVSFRFSDFPDPDTVFFPTVTLTSGAFRYTARSGVDLVRKTVQIVANNPLPTSVEVTALATPDLRSLHGCPVYVPPTSDGVLAVLLQFRTAARIPEPQPVTAPPADGATITALLAERCAGGCHASDEADQPACLAMPAGRLSLCRDEAWSALVGIAARESARLTRVAPRDSGHSYLLRKLLGAPPARAARHPADDTLSEAELVTIQRWIEGGAPAPR